jgi:hypothetical protein
VSAPAVLLTGAGKRYDIVSCFSHLTKTIVADPAPGVPGRPGTQRTYARRCR